MSDCGFFPNPRPHPTPLSTIYTNPAYLKNEIEMHVNEEKEDDEDEKNEDEEQEQEQDEEEDEVIVFL